MSREIRPVNKANQNEYTQFNQQLGRIFVTSVIQHPLEYAKVLIQLDYQPLPSFPTRTIFGSPRIGLPGVFSYIRFIYRQDGLLGLYQGLGYKIANLIVYEGVFSRTQKYLNEQKYFTLSYNQKPEHNPDDISEELRHTIRSQFYNYTNQMMRKSICRVAALAASYPFYVLMTRCCSQFVGKEDIYSYLPLAIYDIYHNEGLLGFYSGFMPKVIGELLIIWVSQGATLIFTSPMVLPKDLSGVNFYISQMILFFVQSIFYPFQLVSSVMSVNSCRSLTAARIEPYFFNWQDCWRYLSQMGQLKRGASLFWRHQPLPRTTTTTVYNSNVYHEKKPLTIANYQTTR